MRGDLRQSSLPEVMRELYAERKSGILQVFRQKIRKRLHFKKGVVIFADSGPAPFSSREQALVLAYSLFTWTSGEYEFLEGDSNIDDALAFEGSPSTVILEGSRRIDEPEILRLLIGGNESVFACTKTTVLPLFKMKLSPAENAILTFARARDRFTVDELPLPSQDLPVLSALNALIAVGLLEIVNRPVPAEPQPVEPPEPAPPPPPKPQASPPAPTPAPVATAPPPPPPPPPPVVPPPATTPAALPPVAAAHPRPAPPAPQPAPPPVRMGPEVPSEMEQLLNTFEAKRAGVAPTPQQPAQPPPPPPVQPAPEPEPPIVEAVVAPEPEPPPVAAAAAPPPSTAAPETTPVDVAPPTAAPTPRPPPPTPPPTVPVASGPSFVERASVLLSAIIDMLPRGRARLIAGGSVLLVGAAIALVLWLTSGSEDGPRPDAVVAADSNEPDQAPEPDPPPAPVREPEPEPVEDLEPAPSEAELFYRANLAFERGDYEQAKAELVTLLELKPDLAAARDLLTKIEEELAPEPTTTTTTRPRRRARRTPPKPKPEPKPEPKPVAPPPPTPAELFASVRNALASGELERAQSKLDELRDADANYPGLQQLQEQIASGMWERKLPLAYSARHDHALGGCDGVLTLTSRGIGFRSKDHDWFWSFAQLSETQRRDARRLRIEVGSSSYNFELRDTLSSTDWSRYQRLRSR